MAGNHSWDGKEIDELTPEILTFDIKDIPRSILKEIAIELNKESPLNGNWESLAERLGFTQNRVLDTLIENARMQKSFPGLLMLQEWGSRPGSTAFVLLHALREIQREDVVGILVQKLSELNSLQLSVSVEGREGLRQFLRVGTRKTAPLHASLDNILQHPLYWYDIVGPRRDVDWNTASGDLQGVQLTLRLRGEPSQHSLEQIYGTSAELSQSYQPGSQTQPDHKAFMGLQGQGVNQLQLNIPPKEPGICVTLGQSQLNVFTQGNVHLQKNNLSSNQPFNIPPDVPQNLNIAPAAADPTLLPPPPVCGRGSPHNAEKPGQPMGQAPQRGNVPAQSGNFALESLLAGFQPMTAPRTASPLGQNIPQTVREALPGHSLQFGDPDHFTPDLPFLSVFRSGFVDMSSDFSHNDQFSASVPQGHMDASHTYLKEPGPCSQTQSKELLTGIQGSHSASVHSEDSVGGAQAAARPYNLGGQSFGRPQGFVGLESPDRESSSSSTACGSLLHPDYVSHEGVIEFCNNPTSPLSGGSDSPSTPQACLPQQQANLPNFLNRQVTRHQGKTPSGCENFQQSGYVPHSFIEKMSQQIRRCTSAPNLDEEEHMQVEGGHSENTNSMDFGEEHGGGGVKSEAENLSTSMPAVGGSRGDGKPQACTYSSYRPDLAHNIHHHHYQNVRPLQHSVSLDDAGDGAYMDMTGTHSTPVSAPHHHQSSSRDDHRLQTSASMDGYMNEHFDPGPDGVRGGDMDNMLHPRSRRPFPHSGGDMFPPTDQAMTLGEESGGEYSYIDPASLRGGASSTPRPQRRSSGGNIGGGSSESRHRKKSPFHKELSDSELQQVPGWHPHVNDRTVDEEMSKYINDDGNFIMWRYNSTEGETKYVISVSHLRSIRHYQIYETMREGKVYYCIFPKSSTRFTRLTDLIRHCMTHGMSEPTKTFRSPDGKETQRGSGRFSHVRLKFPIPCRRKN